MPNLHLRMQRAEGMCLVKRRTALLSSIFLAAAFAAGCSSYRPVPPAFHKVLDVPYRLGAGDRVRVTVFEQDGLTNTYGVGLARYLSVPLVGAVPPRDETTQRLE